MVFPLVVFFAGAVILVSMFGIGWTEWSPGGDDLTISRYLLAGLGLGLALCVFSIIQWGMRSESDRHRKRWSAFILAAGLLIVLGVWWLVSLGLFILVIGLALLVYSSARLAGTYR